MIEDEPIPDSIVQSLVPECMREYVAGKPVHVWRFKHVKLLSKRDYHDEQVIGFNPFSPRFLHLPSGADDMEALNPLHIKNFMDRVDIHRYESDHLRFLEVPIHVQEAIIQNGPYLTLEECFCQAGLVPNWLSHDWSGYSPGNAFELGSPYHCLSEAEFDACVILHKFIRARSKASHMQEIARLQPELWALYQIERYDAENGCLDTDQWERLERSLYKPTKLHIKIATINGEKVGKQN